MIIVLVYRLILGYAKWQTSNLLTRVIQRSIT